MVFAIVNSRTSPGRELSPDPQLPHYGPRFPAPGRLDSNHLCIVFQKKKIKRFHFF